MYWLEARRVLPKSVWTDWVARYDDVFNLYDVANAITVESFAHRNPRCHLTLVRWKS